MNHLNFSFRRKVILEGLLEALQPPGAFSEDATLAPTAGIGPISFTLASDISRKCTVPGMVRSFSYYYFATIDSFCKQQGARGNGAVLCSFLAITP